MVRLSSAICSVHTVKRRFVPNSQKNLQEKAVEATKQKRRKEEKKSKPEEQEGMPQHQHCPPEKRRRDRNPECHEEQQKDVA